MSNKSPTGRRRLGRMAFIPGENPMDYQPYNKNKWGYDFYLADWLEGWNQAKENYEYEQKLKEEYGEDL